MPAFAGMSGLGERGLALGGVEFAPGVWRDGAGDQLAGGGGDELRTVAALRAAARLGLVADGRGVGFRALRAGAGGDANGAGEGQEAEAGFQSGAAGRGFIVHC